MKDSEAIGMEPGDPRRRRQLDKRNERVRRQRAARAAACPEEAAKLRAKEAERQRFKRLSLRRPHAARSLDDRVSEQAKALARFIEDEREDFTVSRCYNPTTLKWSTFLLFTDMNRILSRERMLTDSIIDWHGSAVAEGTGVDRSSIRLMACSTAALMFGGQDNFERIRYDHLSRKERKVSEPKSALEFSKLIFPVCIREHWVTVSVEPPTKTVYVFDSLQNNPARFKDIRLRFDRYIKHQGGGRQKFKTIQVEVPQQSNSIDCGVYVADRIAALLGANDGQPTCTDQATVFKYRARMYLAASQSMHMHPKL